MQNQEITNKTLQSVLRPFSDGLRVSQADEIVQSWSSLIPEQFAQKTKATAFVGGCLKVRVQDAGLYSVLCNYEKKSLVEKLKKRFPKENITNIHFTMG